MSLTGLAFLACFAAGCLMALARHPVYGLVTYIAVFYLHPPSRWWGETLPDLRWSLLAACVTLMALLLSKRRAESVPLFRHGVMIGLIAFIGWIALQSLWAMEPDMQRELLFTYVKYALLVALIYKCIETVEHLKMVLWTHVLGCGYLGIIVLETYAGGRFEGFGGPDINEANSGALQVVTGLATAGALFLIGRWRERAAVVGFAPLLVNALVATISRSGFLALGITGVAFNLFSPRKYRALVRVLSVAAVALLLALSNPVYWMRIASIKYAGEEIEGVDTGAGRLVLIEAQWEMFKSHPLGCGHRCTATLSPYYLEDHHLTGQGENRARSSHNTFMSLLVEQGIPGALFYLAFLAWMGSRLIVLRRRLAQESEFLATMYPAIAASLVAITLGDMFVDYLKLEVRQWFIAFLMVFMKLTQEAAQRTVAPAAARRQHAGTAGRHASQA